MLPFWQAPRGPQRMLATSLAILQGDHAASCCWPSAATPPTSCSRARARGIARSASASRSAPARGASRGLILAENLLLGADGRSARRRRSRSGRPRRCARCRSSAPSRSAFRRTSIVVEPRLCHRARRRVRADLRRGAGAAALARRPADGAAIGIARTAGRSAPAKRADGRRGRARARRAAGRGALLAQLQRRRATPIPASSAKACCSPTTITPAATSARPASRDFAARLLDRLRSAAGRGRGGDRVCRAARHPRPAAALVRARRARAVSAAYAGPGADQHGDARVSPHDGDSAAGWNRLRRSSRCRRAGAGHRQRGVRPPLHRQRRGARPPRRESRHELCRSPASPATRRTSRSARRRRRWSTSRIAIVRPIAARSTSARGPARNRCSRRSSSASFASSIRRCRSTTSARSTSTSRRTCSSAASPRGCSSSSVRCCWCSPRSASTRSSPTRSRSGRRRSACGWRWARRRRRVVSQIVGESLRVIAAGAFVAWFVALFIALHLVRGPIDAVMFVGVPLALLLVAAFASLAAGAARHQRRRHDGIETRLTPPTW